jgi:biopolymer transport protein ExbD
MNHIFHIQNLNIMANLETAEAGKMNAGKVRSKKMSTRIDFTPMVDLGFLLITFFMLTTTLNKPQIMPVVFPEKIPIHEKPDEVKANRVLTLLLGANDLVYYYKGITNPRLDSTNYSAEGLRKVILQQKAEVRAAGFEDKEYELTKKDGTKEQRIRNQAVVLIKPLERSRYKNVVDTFDEMAITDIATYVLLEPAVQEIAFVQDPSIPMHLTAEQQAAANAKKHH